MTTKKKKKLKLKKSVKTFLINSLIVSVGAIVIAIGLFYWMTSGPRLSVNAYNEMKVVEVAE